MTRPKIVQKFCFENEWVKENLYVVRVEVKLAVCGSSSLFKACYFIPFW